VKEASWETLPGPAEVATADEIFGRIAFPTREIGYTASRTALYKTRDGGKTWTRTPLDGQNRIRFLHFATARDGWFGGTALHATRDGNKTWSAIPLQDGEPLRVVTSLAEGPDGWMLVGGSTQAGDLVLYQRPKAGGAWTRLDPVKTGYWGGPGEPYRKWAAGHIAIRARRKAVLLLWRDSGSAGVLVGRRAGAGRRDGGQGSVLVGTSDGGATWSKMFDAPEDDLYRVHFIRSQRGWLTGSRGALWLTEDGGITWQPQTNPGSGSVGCLAFDPAGSGFGIAPLWKGRVLLTRTGQAWQVVEVGLGYSMPAAVVVDPGRAYVLGADGRIARYVDPGVATQP
jgi:photosystem II stability/assembly factor-like uncharacterized protein